MPCLKALLSLKSSFWRRWRDLMKYICCQTEERWMKGRLWSFKSREVFLRLLNVFKKSLPLCGAAAGLHTNRTPAFFSLFSDVYSVLCGLLWIMFAALTVDHVMFYFFFFFFCCLWYLFKGEWNKTVWIWHKFLLRFVGYFIHGCS